MGLSTQFLFLPDVLQWRAHTTPDHPLFLLLNAKVGRLCPSLPGSWCSVPRVPARRTGCCCQAILSAYRVLCGALSCHIIHAVTFPSILYLTGKFSLAPFPIKNSMLIKKTNSMLVNELKGNAYFVKIRNLDFCL